MHYTWDIPFSYIVVKFSLYYIFTLVLLDLFDSTDDVCICSPGNSKIILNRQKCLSQKTEKTMVNIHDKHRTHNTTLKDRQDHGQDT